MKKILLSCACCLLAIGLVTACNNDEEVENDDGTTQDTGTGGGSDTGSGSGGGTGSGGGSSEATTLYNYTLELTLTDESGNDPIPSYATAYIIGDWDNWKEFLPLTGEDKVYSYTFESIDVGWYEFKAVMWYTDEEVDWNNCVEIVTVPYVDEETGETKEGNAYFEVVASQGDDYECKLEYTVTKTLEPRVVSVTSITLDPTTLSFAYEDIAATKTETITASVIGSDGKVMEEEEVTWSSDPETIATVADGVVTPIGPGDAVITAASKTNPEVKATCSVYVAESGVVLVDSITLDKAELTFGLDSEGQDTAILTATLAGENGAIPSNLGVTWTSSEESVATVTGDEEGTNNEDGTVTATVTALGPGETTITAASQEGGKTATCVVSVSATLQYTVTLTLKGLSGSEFVIGEDYDVYLVGAFDMTGSDWNLNSDYILTQVEGADSNVYSVSVGALEATGTYECKLLAEPTGEVEDWSHEITDNFELTFGSSSDVTAEVTLKIDSFDEIFLELGDNTNFYIIFIDTGSTSTETFSSYYLKSGKATFSGSDTWTSVTTGTSGTNSKPYICTSQYATLAANDQDWFYISEYSGDTALLDISTGTITIPATTTGTLAVYVCTVNFSNASEKQTGWNGYWTPNVTNIGDFIAAL